MSAKIKGIYKGFKCISHLFVMKEREMEIGYPTDVKHVAHIGWDGSSGSAPSWMGEYKGGSDLFSPTPSFGIPGESTSFHLSACSSQDFEQSVGHSSMPEMFKDSPSSNLPNIPKKHKRKKKSSSTSSPKCSSSSRSSRSAMSKSAFNNREGPATSLKT